MGKRHMMKKLTVTGRKMSTPDGAMPQTVQSVGTDIDRGGRKKTIIKMTSMEGNSPHKSMEELKGNRKESELLSEVGIDSAQMQSNKSPMRGDRKKTVKLNNYRKKKMTVLDKNFQPKKIDPNAIWQANMEADSKKSMDNSLNSSQANIPDNKNDQDSTSAKKQPVDRSVSDRKGSEDVTNQRSPRVLFKEPEPEQKTILNKSRIVKNMTIVEKSIDLEDSD